MRTISRILAMAAILALMGTAGRASTGSSDAAWEKLKTLVGDWEGTVEGHPAKVSYRLVSSGTAIEESLSAPHGGDMVTIYTRDGSRLLMTHYCSENNQPRMLASGLSPDGRQITFAFLDVANLASPDTSHMVGLVLVIPDADHLTQKWTNQEAAGKTHTGEFLFTRKK